MRFAFRTIVGSWLPLLRLSNNGNEAFELHKLKIRYSSVEAEKTMTSSSVKEEKIDIKQGPLYMPGEKWIDRLKSWKKRYFVFSQIRKGNSNWLKLFYYKNSTWYKEGKMPKDFIDITNASSIEVMDQDIDGNDHIISITAPGKTYHLSASLCDERSQWLLALRAYKYNDKSRLPSTPERAYSWHGRSSSCNETGIASRKSSEPVPVPSMASMARTEKFRDKFMVCLKCKGIDVPREVYEWVPPESSDVYSTIHNPQNKPDNYSEIYEEVRSQVQRPYNMGKREALPLPSENNATECATSDSSTGSLATSIKHAIPKKLFDDVARAVSDGEGGNSPCTNLNEEYIVMSGGKDCSGNEHLFTNSLEMGTPSLPTPLSMPTSLDIIRISDDQHLAKDQELPKSSSTGPFDNEVPFKKTSLTKEIPRIIEYNMYSPDPSVRSSMNELKARRDNLRSSIGIVKPVDSWNPSSCAQNHENRKVPTPSEEQKSISVKEKEAVKFRFSMVDIGDI